MNPEIKKGEFSSIGESSPAVAHLQHSALYHTTSRHSFCLELLKQPWVYQLLVSSGQVSLGMNVLWQEYPDVIGSSATLGRDDYGDRGLRTHIDTGEGMSTSPLK